MKSHTWRAKVTFVGVLLAAGCSDGATSSPTSSAKATGSVTETNATAVFRDPNTSGPRLDVFDAEGTLSVAVSGPLGTENTVIPGLPPDATLVELYRILHPNVEVPSELTTLDVRVAPLLKATKPHLGAPPPVPVALDKSQAQFNSTVCITFGVSQFSQYIPVECVWRANAAVLHVANDYSIHPGDRVYGWNNVDIESFLETYMNTPPKYLYVSRYFIPAYWWTYINVLSGGPYAATMASNLAAGAPAHGEMGTTHHVLYQIVK
jgi:hypothetical protein